MANSSMISPIGNSNDTHVGADGREPNVGINEQIMQEISMNYLRLYQLHRINRYLNTSKKQ